MCKLTNEQMLRYFIFKDCGFDEEIAKKSYDFVMGNEPKPESKPATELADGIYLMYENTLYYLPDRKYQHRAVLV